MRIIGCDLHARQQTLAMLDTETGQLERVTLMQEGNNVREFCSQLPRRVLVGIEATGSMHWFLNLMDELGIGCRVGHPTQIRAAEPRKQKHDRRDADLILKLQAIALANGLRRGPGPWSHDGQVKIALLPLLPHTADRRSALQAMYGKMESEIEKLTQQVAEQAENRSRLWIMLRDEIDYHQFCRRGQNLGPLVGGLWPSLIHAKSLLMAANRTLPRQAPPENLVPGAVVFSPPDHPVALDNHYQWWSSS